MAQDQFVVGKYVRSIKVGATKEFNGEIVSIVDNGTDRFVVLRDLYGRSWYRDFHEIKPLEVIAA
jgi:hypothetical protein